MFLRLPIKGCSARLITHFLFSVIIAILSKIIGDDDADDDDDLRDF